MVAGSLGFACSHVVEGPFHGGGPEASHGAADDMRDAKVGDEGLAQRAYQDVVPAQWSVVLLTYGISANCR